MPHNEQELSPLDAGWFDDEPAAAEAAPSAVPEAPPSTVEALVEGVNAPDNLQRHSYIAKLISMELKDCESPEEIPVSERIAI